MKRDLHLSTETILKRKRWEKYGKYKHKGFIPSAKRDDSILDNIGIVGFFFFSKFSVVPPPTATTDEDP